jgi:hypothetical protein
VLSSFQRLTHLVLMENPVTRKEVCCFSLGHWVGTEGTGNEGRELIETSIIDSGSCGDAPLSGS